MEIRKITVHKGATAFQHQPIRREITVIHAEDLRAGNTVVAVVNGVVVVAAAEEVLPEQAVSSMITVNAAHSSFIFFIFSVSFLLQRHTLHLYIYFNIHGKNMQALLFIFMKSSETHK